MPDAISSLNVANIQRKYQEFNHKFFNGELPDIPISIVKTSKVGGRVSCEVVYKGKPTLRMKKLGIAKAEMVPGSLKMEISSVYQRSEAGLDAIIIHEAIHAFFMSKGDFNESHGPKFVAMAKKIGNQVGYDIPLTDDTKDLALTNDVVKTIAVILIKRPGRMNFSMLSVKALSENVKEIYDTYKRILENGYILGFAVYTIATPQWTKFAKSVPVARIFKTNNQMLRFPEGVTDPLLINLEDSGKRMMGIGDMQPTFQSKDL